MRSMSASVFRSNHWLRALPLAETNAVPIRTLTTKVKSGWPWRAIHAVAPTTTNTSKPIRGLVKSQ